MSTLVFCAACPVVRPALAAGVVSADATVVGSTVGGATVVPSCTTESAAEVMGAEPSDVAGGDDDAWAAPWEASVLLLRGVEDKDEDEESEVEEEAAAGDDDTYLSPELSDHWAGSPLPSGGPSCRAALAWWLWEIAPAARRRERVCWVVEEGIRLSPAERT